MKRGPIDVRADAGRFARQGIPEAVYCPGKTLPQIRRMVRSLRKSRSPVLLTKIEPAMARPILSEFPGARHHPDARLLILGRARLNRTRRDRGKLPVTVVAAGTADTPAAQEAALTLEALGSPCRRIYDVGVAGIHRLLGFRTELLNSSCVIVAAGMEGALPSVVGGVVSCPVIALPTSIGYGTGAGGLAAILGMLNSCAPNVCTVNIDDGFGAGVVAHLIRRGPPTS